VPQKDKVGKLTKDQVQQIAEVKMKDMNCETIESAMKAVAGTARSMGVEVAK
jgi:large subunit ribosomal protein L11